MTQGITKLAQSEWIKHFFIQRKASNKLLKCEVLEIFDSFPCHRVVNGRQDLNTGLHDPKAHNQSNPNRLLNKEI